MKKKLLLSILLVCSIFFLGCTSNRLNYDEDVKVSHKYMKKFATIKDPAQYRPLIEQEIAHFQEPFFSDKGIKKLRASILRYDYERLFVLENALGSKYQADIYFKKAEYWNIISAECFIALIPLTPKEILERAARTKEEVIKDISKLNPRFYEGIKELAKNK